MTALAAPPSTAPIAALKPDYEFVHRRLRDGFDRGELRSERDRRHALKALRHAIERHETDLFEALATDFGKPPFEAYTSEIGFCYQDIDHTLSHLGKWMRPRRASVSPLLWPTTAKSYHLPKGVVLVVAPWNYPVNLSLAPLVAAVAAGCHVVLKPAEDTPHTSRVIERICEAAFAKTQVTVVQGAGGEVVPALMDAGRFDHVFYTGSTRIGRELGARCGRELIPCTLELGGKSPAIVMADADLDVACDRIVWGKFLNVGQTCVAPDYVLVERPVEGAFLRKLQEKIRAAYGKDPQRSPDLARVINDKHFRRLLSLLESATVAHGGQHDADTRFIAPTVLTDVSLDSPLLREEIFGPLLPVIPVDDFEEAKSIISLHPNPLAAYCFTERAETERRFIREIDFGGGCINDTVLHLGIPDLPFGGVQQSGIGRYHGEAGFRTFSNQKSIARTSTLINLPLRYAPYREVMLKAVKTLLG